MILKRIVDIIVGSMDPNMIFLVGYREQNRQNYNIFYGQAIDSFPDKVAHVDLLIIGVQTGSNTTWRIENAIKNWVSATVVIIAPGDFNRCLKKGAYFALYAIEAGYLIFENGNTFKEKANFPALKAWRLHAEKAALHSYTLAEEFLKCAFHYIPEKNNFQNLSLYFLKHAFDSYLRSAITGVLGIALDGEMTTPRLLQLARWTRPAIAEVINSGKKQNQLVLKWLESGTHAALNRQFFIESEALQAVRDKVIYLRKTILPFLVLNGKEQLVGFDKDLKEEVEKW